MRYIRTKDGIFEVESSFLNNKDKWIGYNIVGDDMVILREQVTSQADTIEELCDEFVYCKNGFYEMYRKLDDKHYDKEYLKNGGTIKGAIWTDKGLIYVAKMNEKGELKLI